MATIVANKHLFMKTRQLLLILVAGIALAITCAFYSSFRNLIISYTLVTITSFVFGFLATYKTKGNLILIGLTLAVPYILLHFYGQIVNYWIYDFGNLLQLIVGLTFGLLFTRLGLWMKLISGMLLTVLLVGLCWSVPYFLFNDHISNTSTPISDYVLQDANDQPINSNSLKGKVILMDFWNTSCGYCVKQFSETEALANKYRGNPNVVVLAVNSGHDKREKWKSFTNRLNRNLIFVSDSSKFFTNQLNFQGYPQNILIDKNQNVRHIATGYAKEITLVYVDQMSKRIDELLLE